MRRLLVGTVAELQDVWFWSTLVLLLASSLLVGLVLRWLK